MSDRHTSSQRPRATGRPTTDLGGTHLPEGKHLASTGGRPSQHVAATNLPEVKPRASSSDRAAQAVRGTNLPVSGAVGSQTGSRSTGSRATNLPESGGSRSQAGGGGQAVGGSFLPVSKLADLSDGGQGQGVGGTNLPVGSSRMQAVRQGPGSGGTNPPDSPEPPSSSTPSRGRRTGPGVPGYLQGKGEGKTWKPDEAIAALRAEAEDTIAQLQGMLVELERVEHAFVLVRQAFERTQPPMFNRMTVRWWITQTGQPRVPTLVQVRGTPQGKERPTAVTSPGVRLRKDGAYALNHDLNREVVRIYWQLHALRAEYRDALQGVRKESKGRRGRSAAIAKAARRLLQIRAEATSRLIAVGYEFKPIHLDLPDDGLPDHFWAADGPDLDAVISTAEDHHE